MARDVKNYGTHIVGLFRDESSADCCIRDLKQFGIRSEDICIAQKGRERTAEQRGVSAMGSPGGLDSILNFLGGDTGPKASLVNLGFPDDIAQRYADQVDAGNILLAVKCDGQCEQLIPIFNRCGAFDVNSSAMYGARHAEGGWEASREAGSQPMPIREERLIPRKEACRAGEVEVTKDVVEEQRTMRVPVTHEEAYVEHHPVEPRPGDRGPTEETIRVPLSEEDVTVTKQPIVTGEVEIGKRPVTEEREVRGEVRKEVPRVEKKGEVREEDVRDQENRLP
jgi:uncharacterized protein (TIGR02271 family)